MATIYQLPPYPSTQARKSLSPSQRATLNQKISNSLQQIIALPQGKLDAASTRKFISTYANDAAYYALQGLIWETPKPSPDERKIRIRTLALAQRLASSLDLQILLDLAIVYAPTNISKIRFVFADAFAHQAGLAQQVKSDFLPACTQLLVPSQGLYGIRKASHIIAALLQSSPPELVRPFAHDTNFVVTLASMYDQGLASIAHSYGGLAALRNMHARGYASTESVDDWIPIWLSTKVALMDAFHVLMTTLVQDLTAATGGALAVESERTFHTVFALLELPSTSSADHEGYMAPTPFLDRSLLLDYQQTYSLQQTLAKALKSEAEKDARLDLLESTLRSHGAEPSSASPSKDPGVLKLLLRSSGVPPGIDNLGNGTKLPSTSAPAVDRKGKGKAVDSDNAQPQDPDEDLKVAQVVDVLPEQPTEYVRDLLRHRPYGGNAEKVIEALLEGTAPSPDDLEKELERDIHGPSDELVYSKDRKNVFDNDQMDLSRIRLGKKKGEDAMTVLQDRAFIEQMKADILRRAEAFSNEEEEEVLAYDDESVEETENIKVTGDEEEIDTDGDGTDDSEEAEAAPPRTPETILELAYIRDPKLFDRDAVTRRSKARSDLKAQTGWGDEQIEGWKIMLERNPNKDKILAKHEFAGNRSLPEVGGSFPPRSQSRGRGGPPGRGRGGRGGRDGRGRGGPGGGQDGGGAGSAKDKTWKDKHKASQANHNRKRGHDKKMARAGA